MAIELEMEGRYGDTAIKNGQLGMAESFAGGSIDGGLIDPRADSGRGNKRKRRRERKRSRLGTAEAESLPM